MTYVSSLEESIAASFIDAAARFSRKERNVKQLLETPGMFSKSKTLAKTPWSGIGSRSLPLYLRVKLLDIFMALFAQWTNGLKEELQQEKPEVSCLHFFSLTKVSKPRRLHRE